MRELEATRNNVEIYMPSEYWKEELSNFDYMLDASPLIISKLRHHCYHLTGLRVYDYRSNKEKAKMLFEEKLNMLLRLGYKNILVPESPTLGGFGYEINGKLFNVDTLKFYEALIALKKSKLLDRFINSGKRNIVWEIGAGWGGFAYQFKTICPNSTYIITDFPEVILFSATYLMNVFPNAKFLIYGEVPAKETFKNLEEFDFIFIPNTFLNFMSPERMDLAINMISFQEMTTEQVKAYAKKASDLKCPYMYSLNRDRSLYNLQLTNVRTVLNGYYELDEIPVLSVSYTKVDGEKEKSIIKSIKTILKNKKKSKKKQESLEYKHVVGRLRDC